MQDQILSILAGLLEVVPESLSPDLRFREQGVESAQALSLAAALSEALGREVPVTAVWRHPTVASLAAWLEGGAGASSLLDAVFTHSSERLALRFLPTGEIEDEAVTWTYGDFIERVQRVAAALVGEGISKGDRVLLLYGGGPEFIAALYGCFLVGVVGVPTYPPDPRRVQRTLPRLQAIAKDAQAKAILSTRQLQELAAALCRETSELGELEWMATDCLEAQTAPLDRQPTGSDVAYLQYTSGSTGTPKGVEVTHDNLTATCGAMISRWPYDDPRAHQVSWLPTFHDLGLIWGLMTPLTAGVPVTFMPPERFIQRPLRWLETIDAVRGTMTAAPDFGYALCVRKTTEEERDALDLRCLQACMNAAEPVRPSTVDTFQRFFESAGLSGDAHCPWFGLAEATLQVSMSAPADGPPRQLAVDRAALEREGLVRLAEGEVEAKVLVSCGWCSEHLELAIVEPEGRQRLSERVEGEVWVHGAGVAAGYWRRSEATRETFRASIEGEDPSRHWMRTGDLGFVYDGELFITSRRKDLMIVRGVNIYPQDIEVAAEAADVGIRPGCCAAYPVEVEGDERVGLACEVNPAKVDDLASVAARVLGKVAEVQGVHLQDIVLIGPRQICKTSSGKIQRRRTREALEAGELDVLHRWTSRRPLHVEAQQTSSAAPALLQWLLSIPERHRREALVASVRQKVAIVLGLSGAEAVSAQQPLNELGMDSLMVVELRNLLSAFAQTPLPATLGFDHPTAQAIADFLFERAIGAAAEAMVESMTGSYPNEPIAIISAACRFPGGVDDLEGLWSLLEEGGDVVGEVPPRRWDIERYFDADPDKVGKTYTRWGGFLGDVETFDAAFFGISPREAVTIDPQQRLLLETAWEAVERAGFVKEDLNKGSTGVYVGLCGNDYRSEVMSDAARIDAYSLLGTSPSGIVGRISYWLGLQGPNIAIDTACSSSMVALHLACQGLRTGECDMALAGGVNLLLDPSGYVYFSRLGAMSPTGRCHTFSDDADGYVRSEGCGIVLVKRLSDAQRDGDEVLALIRGTAVNQDGRSNGFTAPNGPAQQAVIRRALEQSGVEAHTVDAVECHGTGTPLGDPIEVQALAAVYGAARSDDQPVTIGSFKSNIGHTEGAAGVAGVLKALVSLRKQTLPRVVHFSTPNRNIEWDEVNVKVAAQNMPWPASDHPRRIGVSSFGFSGTNAHAILEEAPNQSEPAVQDTLTAGVLPLLVSGRDVSALRDQAGRWARWLSENDETSWSEILRTAALHRTHFETRAALHAECVEDAVEALSALAEGRTHAGVTTGEVRGPGKVAMLFTGQGSQRLGMGKGLYGKEGFEVFTAALDAAVGACDAHLGTSLLKVMWSEEVEEGDSLLLNQTRYTQPALFALETALFRQWEAWGVVPDVLMGHSIGELVAAHLAGVLSLEDAGQLVCARGRLMDELAAADGAMAAVEGSEEEVEEAIAGLEEGLRSQVSVAGLNTPSQTVVSGGREAVARLKAAFEGRSRKVRQLTVSHAFHSCHMDGMLEAFEAVAQKLDYAPPSIAVVSNVTGRLADPARGDLVSAGYWVEHVRGAVRFLQGVETLTSLGVETFVECGPDGVLCGMAAECLEGPLSLVRSLRAERESTAAMLAGLGRVHVAGHAVDWAALYGEAASTVVALPTYAFQRQRYWLQAEPSADVTSAGLSRPKGGVQGHDASLEWLNIKLRQAWMSSDVSDLAHGLHVPEENWQALYEVLPHLAKWTERAVEGGVASSSFEEQWKDWESIGDLLINHDVDSYAMFSPAARDQPQTSIREYSSGTDDQDLNGMERALQDMGRRLRAKFDQDHESGWREVYEVEAFPTARWMNWGYADLDDFGETLLNRGGLSVADRLSMRLCHEVVAESVAGQDILEVGCGRGGNSAFIRTGLGAKTVLGLDLSSTHVALAGKLNPAPGLSFVQGDAMALPFEDSRFDSVVNFESAHGYPSMTRFLSEVARVLRPGGSFFFTDFFASKEKLAAFKDGLQECGLTIVEEVDISAHVVQSRRIFSPTFREYTMRLADDVREGLHRFNCIDDSQEFRGLCDKRSFYVRFVARLIDPRDVQRGRAQARMRPEFAVSSRGFSRSVNVYGRCWIVNDTVEQEHHCRELRDALERRGAVAESWTFEEAIARLDSDEHAPPDVLLFKPHWSEGDAYDFIHATANGARLAQCLDNLSLRGLRSVWVVTDDALHVVESDTPRSAGAQAQWGFWRSYRLAPGTVPCNLIDLPSVLHEADALDQVALLVLSKDLVEKRDEYALRDGRLWTRRLKPITWDAKQDVESWQPEQTALITGGTGALGQHLARWLAQRGCRHLVLASRRGKLADEFVAELLDLGCLVETVVCDLADARATDALVKKLSGRSNQPLKAIFHLAGVLRETSLNDLNLESIQSVMQAKLGGAWALHEATVRHETPLTSFVLFGSTAGLLGSHKLLAYSSANAGLAGLVEHRRTRGLPAMVVQWGSWSGGGMVTREVDSTLSKLGIDAMAPVDALMSMERAMRSGRHNVSVMNVRWDLVSASYSHVGGWPLLEELGDVRAAPEKSRDEAGTTNDLRTVLAGLPEAQRMGELSRAVAEQVAYVLGFRPTMSVDVQRPLKDYGLDSLMALDLRRRLSSVLGLSLPAYLTFDYPTVNALTGFLSAELGGKQEMSDDEIRRKLNNVSIDALRSAGLLKEIMLQPNTVFPRKPESNETDLLNMIEEAEGDSLRDLAKRLIGEGEY